MENRIFKAKMRGVQEIQGKDKTAPQSGIEPLPCPPHTPSRDSMKFCMFSLDFSPDLWYPIGWYMRYRIKYIGDPECVGFL